MFEARAGECNGRREKATRFLAATVAGVFVVLGVAAAATPDIAIGVSRYCVSPLGIYAAAALRCGMGLALFLIAQGSRAPIILRIMGVAFVIAGLTFPMLGVESAKARIEWEADHLVFLRLEGLLFIWVGFVVYKLSKPRMAQFSATPSNSSQELN